MIGTIETRSPHWLCVWHNRSTKHKMTLWLTRITNMTTLWLTQIETRSPLWFCVLSLFAESVMILHSQQSVLTSTAFRLARLSFVASRNFLSVPTHDFPIVPTYDSRMSLKPNVRRNKKTNLFHWHFNDDAVATLYWHFRWHLSDVKLSLHRLMTQWWHSIDDTMMTLDWWHFSLTMQTISQYVVAVAIRCHCSNVLSL